MSTHHERIKVGGGAGGQGAARSLPGGDDRNRELAYAFAAHVASTHVGPRASMRRLDIHFGRYAAAWSLAYDTAIRTMEADR